MREAQAAGCRAYLTLNAFLYAADWKPLREQIGRLNHLSPDAVIVSDPAALQLLARETDLHLHVSTQASAANGAALRFWASLGARRVVLARELSLRHLRELRAAFPADDKTPLELEVFVHGAMCTAWSGKCTISNYLSARDANRGGCTHACRWDYEVAAAGRGQFFCSRELNLMTELPRLLDSGVDSLKIEGRMRSVHYVATVTRLYREALDHITAQRQQGRAPDRELLMQLSREATTIGNRRFTRGHLLRRAGVESISRAGAVVTPALRYIGRLIANRDGWSWCEIAAPFDLTSRLEQLEYIAPGMARESHPLPVTALSGPRGERLTRLRPNSVLRVATELPGGTILQARRIRTGKAPTATATAGSRETR